MERESPPLSFTLNSNLYTPITKVFTKVFDESGLIILKEAGPAIFVQSHTLIVPSGSLELLPSSETLSVGKVITWSGPAKAMGGLLSSLHLSNEVFFAECKYHSHYQKKT